MPRRPKPPPPPAPSAASAVTSTPMPSPGMTATRRSRRSRRATRRHRADRGASRWKQRGAQHGAAHVLDRRQPLRRCAGGRRTGATRRARRRRVPSAAASTAHAAAAAADAAGQRAADRTAQHGVDGAVRDPVRYEAGAARGSCSDENAEDDAASSRHRSPAALPSTPLSWGRGTSASRRRAPRPRSRRRAMRPKRSAALQVVAQQRGEHGRDEQREDGRGQQVAGHDLTACAPVPCRRRPGSRAR